MTTPRNYQIRNFWDLIDRYELDPSLKTGATMSGMDGRDL